MHLLLHGSVFGEEITTEGDRRGTREGERVEPLFPPSIRSRCGLGKHLFVFSSDLSVRVVLSEVSVCSHAPTPPLLFHCTPYISRSLQTWPIRCKQETERLLTMNGGRTSAPPPSSSADSSLHRTTESKHEGVFNDTHRQTQRQRHTRTHTHSVLHALLCCVDELIIRLWAITYS